MQLIPYLSLQIAPSEVVAKHIETMTSRQKNVKYHVNTLYLIGNHYKLICSARGQNAFGLYNCM